MDEAKIKFEAKEIMDNFIKALSKIEVENEYMNNRDVSLREETIVNSLDENFKNIFLKNAPNTSGDAILANKGEWTKK